jgi:hypothetical protein
MSDEIERIHHNPPTALIPEKVGIGLFSTEVVVFHSESEVAIDFIQGIAKPYRVVRRVIMANSITKTFFEVLKNELNSPKKSNNSSYVENLKNKNYEESLNKNQQKDEDLEKREKVDDIYRELKIENDELSGFYANKVLINYGTDSICLDFISNIYPKSIVTSRIFVTNGTIIELLSALNKIFNNNDDK